MGMRFACISHGHLALFEHNLVVGRVNSTQYTLSSEVDLIVVAMTIIIIIIIFLPYLLQLITELQRLN